VGPQAYQPAMQVRHSRLRWRWPCVGPRWDHTSCAMLNDVRVSARHTARLRSRNHRQPGETRYRCFLGVKWSQVQILSARQSLFQVKGLSVARMAPSYCRTHPRTP